VSRRLRWARSSGGAAGSIIFSIAMLTGNALSAVNVLLVNKGRRDQNGVLRITIREGRNRQVRRMLEAVGHPVQSLRRIRFGPLTDRSENYRAW